MLSTFIRQLRQPGPGSPTRSAARSLAAAALHLLWPWRCPLCGQDACSSAPEMVCPACSCSIKADLAYTCCKGCGRPLASDLAEQQRCGTCQVQPMAFEALAVAGHYTRSLRRVIVQWKFSRHLRLEPLLIDLLSDTLTQQSWYVDVEAFVPIPQPWTRWVRRGFSWPVRDLASGVSTTTAGIKGKPVWPVLRARRHHPQVGLTKAQRIENAKGVFYVPASVDLTGRRLCLVDDVSTTGATLDSAAKALRKAGAEHVWSLVLAKTHGGPDA